MQAPVQNQDSKETCPRRLDAEDLSVDHSHHEAVEARQDYCPDCAVPEVSLIQAKRVWRKNLYRRENCVPKVPTSCAPLPFAAGCVGLGGPLAHVRHVEKLLPRCGNSLPFDIGETQADHLHQFSQSGRPHLPDQVEDSIWILHQAEQ